ncbi:MAG: hypothetical protein ACJZ14_04300 [Candidatus Neomarinimicrobiota bacterium]
MIKRIILLIVVGFLLADDKTFIREYTYQASEDDSKVTSRDRALSQVKVLLLEEIAVFVRSEFITTEKSSSINGNYKNEEIDVQTISSISAGITKIKILDEKWTGTQYWIKALITLDPDDVMKRINEIILSKDSEPLTELSNSMNLRDGSLYVISIDEIFIDEVDFTYKKGDFLGLQKVPVTIGLFEDENIVWEIDTRKKKGRVKLNKTKVLRFNPYIKYSILIAEGFIIDNSKLSLTFNKNPYWIKSKEGEWMFNKKKITFGKKSYIIVDQLLKND